MEHLQNAALPLHIQKLEQALNLDYYLHDVQSVLKSWPSVPTPSNLFTSLSNQGSSTATKRLPSRNGCQYNFTNIAHERQWIKDLLLSESDDSMTELTDLEQVQMMLILQYKRKKWKRKLKRLTGVRQYQYMSAGLLLPRDRYPEINREEEKKQIKRKRVREDRVLDDDVIHETEWGPDNRLVEPSSKEREEERAEHQKNLWSYIAKKEVPRMAKLFSQARHTVVTNNKKIAMFCQREVKRWAIKSQRQSKEASSVQPRARRVMREMLVYWRKHEKIEKEQRRKAEKEAVEQHKLNEEMREAKRQQRKLNFLITQTELYAHFMAKKLTGEKRSMEDILSNLEDTVLQREVKPGVLVNLEEPNEYDSEAVKAQAVAKVQSAVERQKSKRQAFVDAAATDGATTDLQQSFDDNFSLANPAFVGGKELPQPSVFRGQLKVYQLKGMNWLASLYNQGINGILADEMGLGKTVQSIALLASLSERQNIWGPFLVVSPASTLHNWQQECTKFVPAFKVLPYWGSPHERKVIRKYWNQKLLSSRNSPFHILITSYQLVVQDFRYFQRVKWQYMILDEAQAIKSSSSVRWKMLMSFNCRNRLLLTGTPIQNTMAELWALLHFIMPTMFDSHEEFNEWFSRDIESHAEKKSALDENQLSRLHMILKPFMLRRIKKDVEHEMAEKIEVHLTCGLSTRQKKLYYRLRERISIDDLLHSSTASYHPSKDSASHLMNLVMQFRKVCNHPDLFERRDVRSPLHLPMDAGHLPRLIYHEIVHPNLNRLRLLRVLLGIHCASHAHQSALSSDGLWSFLHPCGMSVAEACSIFSGSIADRLQVLMNLSVQANLIYMQRMWNPSSIGRGSGQRWLWLWPSQRCSAPSIADSQALSCLVFTSHTSTVYTHSSHSLLPLRHNWQENEELNRISSTVSSCFQEEDAFLGVQGIVIEKQGVARSRQRLCVPIEMPKFLLAFCPRALAPLVPLYISNREAEYHRQELVNDGSHQLRLLLQHGVREWGGGDVMRLSPAVPSGFDATLPLRGWSHIHIAHKETMITDSGKMAVLDKLLVKLKREDHRVLIYSQMTRMIDLLEEYMAHRRYRYIRLDGSSRISDRRDMVDDFQTKSDIFVFLLSTRAGGLGINLTAADTVIFYDSDWNPTVDQQAMDRAHRLGQTKQVTVYRLIVKGSIEERILQRAHEKSEIQKMVISGGDFKSDALKPKEVVSLLLDDEEMESRFLTKQAERRAQEEQNKRIVKPKKKRYIQKSAEGTPPAKVARRVSISPSPSISRPGSVLSHSSDLANGDFVDVVAVTVEDTNGVVRKASGTVTPTRTSRKICRKSGSSNNRLKKRPSLGATTTSIILSQSPSSLSSFSIPGNAHSFGEVVNNGGSSHSSPQSSPFPPSLPVISVTPPSHRSSKL